MDNQKIIHPFLLGRGAGKEGRHKGKEGRTNAVYGQPQGIQTLNFLIGRLSLREKIFFNRPGFFCLAAFLVFTDPSSTDQKPYLLKDQKY